MVQGEPSMSILKSAERMEPCPAPQMVTASSGIPQHCAPSVLEAGTKSIDWGQTVGLSLNLDSSSY